MLTSEILKFNEKTNKDPIFIDSESFLESIFINMLSKTNHLIKMMQQGLEKTLLN